MSNNQIKTQVVKIPVSGIEIPGFLAVPQGDGPFQAVVVLQEIFGVNNHIQDVTQRFAQAGFVALAPAIFERTVPGLNIGYTNDAVALGRKHKDLTRAETLLADVSAAIKFLHTLPQVKKNSVGVIGFCFGGHVAYLAATLPEVTATASFYGAGIANTTPGGGPPTVTQTSKIHGSIYLFFGSRDAMISVDDVTTIKEALKVNNTDHKIYEYNADHGFFCDQRQSYDAKAAQDAWQKVLMLFRAKI